MSFRPRYSLGLQQYNRDMQFPLKVNVRLVKLFMALLHAVSSEAALDKNFVWRSAFLVNLYSAIPYPPASSKSLRNNS